MPVDGGLERHDLLQLLKDVAVWEAMPRLELEFKRGGAAGSGSRVATLQNGGLLLKETQKE